MTKHQTKDQVHDPDENYKYVVYRWVGRTGWYGMAPTDIAAPSFQKMIIPVKFFKEEEEAVKFIQAMNMMVNKRSKP